MPNVIISPESHWQFLDTAGKPLSNGFIFTYDAGTTNLRNTYTDSTGTVFNPNPIPLDATGSPSNGSAQTGIWLANQSYKFVAYNSAMVQQWSSDNISGYFSLLNQANVWTFPQTFTQPITDTVIDNQFVTGAVGNQTTLDFPPPTGNQTLHFPTTSDTMVGRDTTDTLTNKTLTSPTITNPTITGIATGLATVLYKNATSITHTGTVTDDNIYTVSVPILAVSSILRITLNFHLNGQGVPNTIVTVRLAGTIIAQVTFNSGTISALAGAFFSNILLCNRSLVTSQVTSSAFINNGTIAQVGGPELTALNTGVITSLTVSAQNGTAGDQQLFDSFMVEIL